MPNLLFLTLKVFSTTGGIEKVCRIAGKALYEFGIEKNIPVQIFSMYDKKKSAEGNKYFPTEIFHGFDVSKINFMSAAVQKGVKSRVVILSHFNLLLAGWLIKKLNPSVKLILLAHGIEIWGKKNVFKKKMLNSCDQIISVSAFTQKKLMDENSVSEKNCDIINNCLDPFLPLPQNVKSPKELIEKYGLSAEDKILFTLSRLSALERYKGYDKVMQAMVDMPANIKYVIAGSYDAEEKKYIENLIVDLQLHERVILTGYIPDDEVAVHFAMCDCYVMPSVKEGFGIVFIEAMYYNLPTIAGNADGSVDALKNGQFGILVNPDDIAEIKTAINNLLNNREAFLPNRKLLMEAFGYPAYKKQWNALLEKYTIKRLNLLPNQSATFKYVSRKKIKDA